MKRMSIVIPLVILTTALAVCLPLKVLSLEASTPASTVVEGDPASTEPAGADAAVDETLSRIPSPTLSAVQGEITMLADPEAQMQYNEWKPQFSQENPEIVVQYIVPPEVTIDDGMDYYARVAQVADVTALYPDQPNLADHYLDLQGYLDRDANFNAGDFWPGAIDGCRDSTGYLLGIPYRIDSLEGIFYDRKIFAESGVPYPSAGWTLDQFREALRRINRPYRFVDHNNSDRSILGSQVEQKLSAGQGILQADQLSEQIDRYLELANQGVICPPQDALPSAEFQEGWNAFFDENHPALWVGALGSSMPGTGRLYSPDDPLAGVAILEAGFVPFPTGEGMESTTPVQVTCLAISKNAKNPEAAWAWIEFLSRQWDGKETSETLWQLPVRSSTAEESGFWELLPAQAASTVRFALAHGWYGSRYPDSFADFRQEWSRALDTGEDVLSVLRTQKP